MCAADDNKAQGGPVYWRSSKLLDQKTNRKLGQIILVTLSLKDDLYGIVFNIIRIVEM